MVVPSAALLALPLTVAVHRTKKPFIYAGFDNLMTDETQILPPRHRAHRGNCVAAKVKNPFP
jgi:hypothetical protein